MRWPNRHRHTDNPLPLVGHASRAPGGQYVWRHARLPAHNTTGRTYRGPGGA